MQGRIECGEQATHATGCGPGGPTRRGVAQAAVDGRIVLTHLLTTTLDQPGQARRDSPLDRGDCCCLDAGGRPSQSS
jgi:hypothetical protein